MGTSPLVVTDLGRWILSGNSQAHTMRVVRASDGAELVGTRISLATSGASTNGFKYVTLPAPVTLDANTAYYIVTQETSSGDTWYEFTTPVTGGTGITVNGGAWAYNTGGFTVYSGSQSYGPVSFKATPSTWNLSKETHYIYNGMLVIQERDGSNAPQISYTRGKDLSGGMQGAGGIGGLLAQTAGNVSQYYHSDGLGNVTALANVGNQLSAQYAYDPYGNLLASAGPMADLNRYRFSSKDFHAGSGTYYFGRRFYDPNFQRWLNRDPLREAGGINLFGFLKNGAGNGIDPFGQCEMRWEEPDTDGPTALDETAPSLREFVGGSLAFLLNTVVFVAETVDWISEQSGITKNVLGHPPSEIAEAFGGEGIGGLEEAASAVSRWSRAAREAELAKDAERLAAEAAAKAAPDTTKGVPVLQMLREAREGCPTGVCFASGTVISTECGERPIEELKVGDRVLTTDRDARDTAVDPATWRKIILRMPNPECPSDIIDIELLRSFDWIDQVGCTEGGQIWLNLDEMGLHGWAQVARIESCPRIESGCGRVVLATVTHFNGFLMELRLDGVSEPLQPTDRHRLFSATRNDWVPAASLKVGEELATKDGTARVESISAKPGIHRVYNLEVETEHCYYAGEAGVLSHNNSACSSAKTSQIDRAAFKAEREAFWKAEAKNNPGKYSAADLEKMEAGRAPIGPDGYPMELHHVDRTPQGGTTPMSRTDHRLGDNYKKNHP